MACCTTITPPPTLNASQKRSSASLFEMANKRQRPFTMSITSSNSSAASASPFHVTSSSSSPFKVSSSTDRSDTIYEDLSPDSSDTESSNGSEIMARIRMEAKRLIRRKQLSMTTTATTTTTTTTTTPSSTSSSSSSSSLNSSTNSSSSTLTTQQNDNASLLSNSLASVNISNALEANATAASINANTNKSTSSSTSNLFKASSLRASSSSSLLASSSSSSSSLSLSQSCQQANRAIPKLKNPNDIPLFSMNHVNAICERMLREREEQLREQYDKILAQKLNEQYDSFVKFSQEQIHRRYDSSQCSYVS